MITIKFIMIKQWIKYRYSRNVTAVGDTLYGWILRACKWASGTSSQQKSSTNEVSQELSVLKIKRNETSSIDILWRKYLLLFYLPFSKFQSGPKESSRISRECAQLGFVTNTLTSPSVFGNEVWPILFYSKIYYA
jgi:hypothetical protein